MSINAVSWALKQELPAVTKMVLICLADHHNGETGQCNPSHKRIAKFAGVAQRTVETHLKKLVGGPGPMYIYIEHKYRPDGSRTSNQYNLPIRDDGNEVDSLGWNMAVRQAKRAAPMAGEAAGGAGDTVGGDAGEAAGGEPNAEQEPGKEPGIKEPGKEHLASPTKRAPVPYSEELKIELLEVYKDVPQASFQIDLAMSHVAAAKHKDKNLYLRNWLNRSRKDQGGNNARNGIARVNSAQDNEEESRHDRAQRMANDRGRVIDGVEPTNL